MQRTKTKHQAISDALLDDIEQGRLQPGDRLPSEDRLASELGYSLGTVQRALRSLVNLGVVVRVHGSGTFVCGARPPESHLRHFRFRSEGGKKLLPVYFETASLEATKESGPWSAFLGDDCNGYVKIERLISVNREFEVFSEVYLSGSGFSTLLDKQPHDFDGVSIRDMLSDTLGTPTVRTDQALACGPLPPRVSRRFGVPSGMTGMILTIQSRTYRHAPIIWQRAFVPASDRQMEILDTGPTTGQS